MEFDVMIQTVAIVGSILGLGGIVYKIGHKSGVDQTCIETIESDVAELKKTIGKKGDNSSDTHKDLYEKIDETNVRCGRIETNVSYIKGKIDQALAK